MKYYFFTQTRDIQEDLSTKLDTSHNYIEDINFTFN